MDDVSLFGPYFRYSSIVTKKYFFSRSKVKILFSSILDLFGNPFANLFWTISFGSGLFVGVIVVSNFVEYLFGFHRKLFEVSILGLLWSSILYLFLSVVSYLNFGNVFGVLLLFVFGFGISYVMSKQ